MKVRSKTEGLSLTSVWAVTVEFVKRVDVTECCWKALDLTAALTRARFIVVKPAEDRISGLPRSVISAGLTVENLNGWFGSMRWRPAL